MAQSVTSAEYQKSVGRYGRVALREPLTITNHGQDSLVLLSSAEYGRLKSLDNRKALYVWELDEEMRQAIANAESSPEAAAFDYEMDGYEPS